MHTLQNLVQDYDFSSHFSLGQNLYHLWKFGWLTLSVHCLFLVLQLSNATSLLDQAQQPYNYLIDSIRSRDAQIEKHKDHITALEEDIR